MVSEEIITPSTFRVEVQNPQGIFNMLKKRETALDPEIGVGETDEQLSSTKLDGDLVMKETTDSSLFGDIKGTQIMIGSSIDISEAEQQSPEQGYFNADQIRKIKDILQERELGVAVRDIPEANSLDIYLDNGVMIGVDLGYKSREDKAAKYQELVQNDLLRRSLIRRVVRGAETNFANDDINLRLFKGEQGEEPTYFLLSGMNSDEFENIIKTYANGYQQIMEAVHQAKGKKLPEKPIILAW